jgi:SAM-dependent methyltransferase
MSDLQLQFGQIDIYLFDQLLRGRIPPGARILDAGCGEGRNLVYLLRAGYDVFAVDSDRACIQSVQRIAAQLAPAQPADNFRVEPLEAMSFPDGFADVVLSSAVLHFARDEALRWHVAWHVARPPAGRPPVLPARLVDRHGASGSTDRGASIPVAGRIPALPRG